MVVKLTTGDELESMGEVGDEMLNGKVASEVTARCLDGLGHCGLGLVRSLSSTDPIKRAKRCNQ